jgi:hypothetical protein
MVEGTMTVKENSMTGEYNEIVENVFFSRAV